MSLTASFRRRRTLSSLSFSDGAQFSLSWGNRGSRMVFETDSRDLAAHCFGAGSR
jgi:hypothetical protein